MAKKQLAAKPGTQKGIIKPDNIVKFEVPKVQDASQSEEPQELKLMDFLQSAMPDRKRTTIKDFLKYRQVMVNGNVTTRFDLELHPGDDVRVNTTREFQTFYHPRMRLVYEDDDIIVVEKGYGLLSMGTDKVKEGTAYSILRDYLKRKDPRNKIFIVHRLDRDTSGLMMFAKNIRAKEAMQHNWNNMVLERKYLAVVEGTIEPESGEIRSYLAENTAHQVYSTPDPKQGQLAVTYYKTLRKKGAYSLVELSLATGRKNQIRVHMKDTGHPIAGDHRYGAKTSPAHRLCLHAATLRFVHPVTRKDMNFNCNMPAAFSKLV